ncbi:MAG: hypothetical protein H7X89_16730 [Rhizobiales bacterium]|nr:hypothetical protein [Hyphomicrobiales bacterium]
MRRFAVPVIATVLVSVVGLQTSAQAGVIFASNFSELSSAINAANLDPGSTIYLAPGTYSGGELPNILANLSIFLDPAFGAPAGSAVLNTTPTGKKGLLTVPSGLSNISLSVDGLTFQNAAISNADGGNAAGIRFQSAGPSSLLVTNSTFLGNQNGILTGFGAPLIDEELMVSISNSLFANNGSGSGQTHGIYIFGESLEVTNSIFCGTNVGHDIKARTAITTVTGSSFYDGIAGPDSRCGIGSASYSIDLPNGGQGILDDNDFFQGAAGENFAIISYGAEGIAYPTNTLSVTDSVFQSTISGRGIQQLTNGVPTCITPVQLANNVFSANLTPVVPADCIAGPGPDPDPDPTPVDEPGTAWLMIVVLMGLGWQHHRRSRIAAAIRH